MSFHVHSWVAFSPKALVAALLVAGAHVASSAEPDNPYQASTTQAKNEKEWVQAQADLLKAEAELAKAKYPALPEGLGKDGTLTVDAADRDKMHVMARTAESYETAAKRLAELVRGVGKVVMLTEADRHAILIYQSERRRLDGILSRLPKPAAGSTKTESLGLVGAAAALSQIVQIAKLFRTDRGLSFTQVELPDEFLLDLIAVNASSEDLLYPGGELDSIYSDTFPSDYRNAVWRLLEQRQKLALPPALLTEIDALLTALAAVDATTKQPYLITVLRGELGARRVDAAKGKTFTVRVAGKGGMSMKTSGTFRSDQLYASGGVIVTYRLTGGDGNPGIVKAGFISEESKFVKVPLSN